MENVFYQIASGQPGFITIAAWALIAVFLGAGGGALGGMFIGAASLGKELAAMMGAFYGVVAAVPGILLSFAVLALI